MGDISEALVPYLPYIRIPNAEDHVYKDECCLSYDTPYSEGGLYVCLNTFLSFGRKYVMAFHEWTGNSVFLHLKKIPILKEEIDDSEIQQPTRLAIGVEGGFRPNEQNEQKFKGRNMLVILPDFQEFSTDKIEEIPPLVLMSVQAVLNTESAQKKEELLAWDGEVRMMSKHAKNLTQLNNDVCIPPYGWKCSRCDLTANLWANLSDGTILCGRKYFDGSGGNGHALDHFRETGFPLVVKLGTITPNGADVYSYDEDDMVEDPFLAQHLLHFGINRMEMDKSDKTMTELEIHLNQKVMNEWDIIQESGKQLMPLYGPGYTGMKNLGNSCYLNSVIQVLSSIREFSKVYEETSSELFKGHMQDPCSDFNTQISKVFAGLMSGDYSNRLHDGASSHDNKTNGITPASFKRLVGKGHVEFSSNRQQDAQEFLMHLMQLVEKNSRLLGTCPSNCFKFLIEERIECDESRMVRYSERSEFVMALPVPYDYATNLQAVHEYEAMKEKAKKDKTVNVEDVVRANVPFRVCLEKFMQDDVIEDFWSPALERKTTAKKRTRFTTFPEYLIIQLKKFMVGNDWIPKKLDVSVDMPDTLNLEKFRGKGLQDNEILLPEKELPITVVDKGADVDDLVVSQLVETGFPFEACRKAVYYTGNCGAEVAMSWLMEHISDTDFAEPLQLTRATEQPQCTGGATSLGASEDSAAMLVAMGFTKDQALKALKSTNSNVERAADWLFSHLDELDTISAGEGDNLHTQSDVSPMQVTQCGQSAAKDGPGIYDLCAFISHMGTSTMCGHYVCHVKKNGTWAIFNDEKVAESKDPPKSLGYLYFYKRR